MPKHVNDTSNDIYSNHNRSAKTKIIVGSIIAAILVIVVIFIASFAYMNHSAEENEREEVLANDTFFSGISVEGVNLEGKTMQQAQEELKQLEPSLHEQYEVTLSYGEKLWTITDADLTFTYNTDAVLQEAFQLGREGTEEEKSEEIASLKESPVDYSIEVQVGFDNLPEKIHTIAEEINQEPTDATVSSFDSSKGEFVFEEGKDGLSVNEEELLEKLQQVLETDPTGAIEIPVTTIAHEITVETLSQNMKPLGTYQTVSTNTADGNHNMMLGMQAINGVCVAPGATFSFNGTTGDTTTGALGYRPAVAISGGKKVMEYGGGICQVSTTLYGAALRSNMQIVERYNHMWPSTYCPIGQDATVSYGSLDFKFKNPTDYPIYIMADMTGTTLTVTLYGYQSPNYDEIKVNSWQTGTIPQTEDKYEVDNSLQKDEIRLLMKGNPGRTASAERVFYKDGEIVKTESIPSSRYRPVSTIYQVGPGTDTSQIVNGSLPSSSQSSQSSSSSTSSTPNPPSSSEVENSSSTPESSSSNLESNVSEPISSSSESNSNVSGDSSISIAPSSSEDAFIENSGSSSPENPSSTTTQAPVN